MNIEGATEGISTKNTIEVNLHPKVMFKRTKMFFFFKTLKELKK